MIDKYPTKASPEASIKKFEVDGTGADEEELVEAIVAYLDQEQIDRESVLLAGHSKIDSGTRMATFAMTLDDYVRLLERGEMTPLSYASAGEYDGMRLWEVGEALDDLYSEEPQYYDGYADEEIQQRDLYDGEVVNADKLYISLYDKTKLRERSYEEYETQAGTPVSDALIATFDVTDWR